MSQFYPPPAGVKKAGINYNWVVLYIKMFVNIPVSDQLLADQYLDTFDGNIPPRLFGIIYLLYNGGVGGP